MHWPKPPVHNVHTEQCTANISLLVAVEVFESSRLEVKLVFINNTVSYILIGACGLPQFIRHHSLYYDEDICNK